MSIIRGERVGETALLTASKELHFSHAPAGDSSFIEEECARAFQKGCEHGEKTGYERGQNEIRVQLNLIQTLTRKLFEHKQHLIDQMKPEVIEFAMNVCERVIRKELGHPEALVKLINSLLTYASSHFLHETLQIILAPEDLVMLDTHLSHIHYDKREIEGVRFHADPLMKRGDCRIETPGRLLNYAISRELADLQTKILR